MLDNRAIHCSNIVQQNVYTICELFVLYRNNMQPNHMCVNYDSNGLNHFNLAYLNVIGTSNNRRRTFL